MYTDKIKTIEELVKIIPKRPRNKKIVLAHGVFDILHPGHLRHLTYAKEKGDILITSLTADKYVSKGSNRPYVNQELRAKGLAALELVDYVVIDYNETPLRNISLIQPEIFCKGFEYRDVHNPKTKDEINTVESYGGEVIFSPGDVVYSSTHLLSLHKPNLSIEKLESLMEAEGVTWDDVKNTIDRFKGVKVLVIGDTIVDRYSYCSLLGQTTATPTFSVKLEVEKDYVGGAGIVAKHFKSLGTGVEFVTVFGNDKLGEYVKKDLKDFGVVTYGIVDQSRPTTLKNRYWAEGYKLLQVDYLDNAIISDKILRELCHYVATTNVDIIVFSDFRHGILHKTTIPELLDSIPLGVMKVADSQVSNRWGNILDFRKDFDILFPNEKEARWALGDQDSGIRSLGADLYKQSGAKYIVLKLGEKGMMVFRGDTNPRDFFVIDSLVSNLRDANGAGDCVLSVTSLGYFVSKNILIASILGSVGAAIKCEKEGNIPITLEEIKEKISIIKK